REPHRGPAPGDGAMRVRDAEGPAEGRSRRRGGRVSTPPAPSERFPTCLVVDFGAQYAQLIARRVREAHVYSEIVPHSITAAEVRERRPAAIVLSGGPRSVHVEGAPRLDPEIYELGIPILGICYGAQLVAQQLGGEVARGGTGEYGRTELTVTDGSGLFADQPVHQTVWMSHFDGITRVPEGFRATATTDGAPVAALESPERRIWAVQHHPEVSHTPFGQRPLRHFLHHLTVTDGSGLFADQPVHQTVWMSHFDGITRVPEGFRATATTDGAPVAALESPERRIWAVQHHPEVSHTPFGQQLLRHFLHHLAG